MTALSHSQWRTILLPVAREAVERGEFPDAVNMREDRRENYARLVANYSATDMVLSGRTAMLDMDEVRAALGDALPTAPPLCRATPRAAARLGSDERLPLSQERKRA